MNPMVPDQENSGPDAADSLGRERLLGRFELALGQGRQPRLEEYLEGASGQGREALLRELLELERIYRVQRGDSPAAGEYLARFPRESDLVHQVFAAASTPSTDRGQSTGRFGGVGGPGPAPEGVPVLAGYEVLGELGRGGMGVVYKARHGKLNRLVALKMILAGTHAAVDDRSRFRTEAEAVARLQHPNIVQIYEIGEQNGLPWLSFEYAEGGSLAQKLDGTPWKPLPAAELIRTLAQAMHAAHRKGIVHRDLKPANVLLAADATPKISDFGLAKRLDVEVGQTQSGHILGTPSYMAPEQARGRSKEIGPHTDVYALGVVLYELLTGRPPFVAASFLDTLSQVLNVEPVPPRRLQPTLPRDLETICLKCLAKQPDKRYATAEALTDDLQRFLEGRPIQARPVSPAERLWRWSKRNPALATTSCLAGVAFLAATLVLILFAVNESRNASRAREDAGTLNKKQLDLQEALKERDRQAKEAQQQATAAKRQYANLFFEQTYVKCQDDAGQGLLWLAHSLREAVKAEHPELEHSIRLRLDAYRRNRHRLQLVFDHFSACTAVFSPDGTMLLTGDIYGTARLWNLATGRAIGSPFSHKGPVCSGAFSRDGKIVLTGSHDKTARLWAVATGKSLAQPLLHQGVVDAAAFSPDGKLVLTGSSDRTARLWDVRTGKAFGDPLMHDRGVREVAFSRDGRTFLTHCHESAPTLWQRGTAKPQPRVVPHEKTSAVAFSSDGKLLVTGSKDGTAQIWNVSTGKASGPPLLHRGWVRAVAFAPDGRWVLTGGDDGTAQIWEASTGKALGAYRHGGLVRTVAFSSDGKTVATGGLDGRAQVWDAMTGQPVGPPVHHVTTIDVLSFSSNGKLILTGYRGSQDASGAARLWAVGADGALLRSFPHPNQGSVDCATLSPDGRTVLTGCSNQTAHFWDVKSGKTLGPPLPHGSLIRAMAFSPDGKTALAAGRSLTKPGGELRLWDVRSGTVIGLLTSHQNFECAAFSPNGKAILTGSFGGPAQLWDAKSLKPVGPALPHPSSVCAVVFRSNGRTLQTGCVDGRTRQWDAATGKLLKSSPPQEPINTIAYNADGTIAISGAMVGETARLWDLHAGLALGPPLQHRDSVQALAMSPDGKVALTTNFNVVVFWEVRTAKQIGLPLQHPRTVDAVAFSTDGKRILTGNRDGIARLWQAPAPLKGSPEQIILWSQVITGMELDDSGAIRVLEAQKWTERRDKLAKLGGPPGP